MNPHNALDDRQCSPSLPKPPRPQGHYLPAIAKELVVVTAGMTPRVNGRLVVVGTVGADISVAEARRAAAIAAEVVLAAIADVVGGLDRIEQLLRMTVYIRAVSSFTEHSAVADGASEALVKHLGERGRVARSAVGVASLPGGACVELDVMALRQRRLFE